MFTKPIIRPPTGSKRETALDRRQKQLADAEQAYRAKMRFLNGNEGVSVEESRRRSLEAIDNVATVCGPRDK